jgi:RHH-type rel operon transcriptional repressor/antitoxin RelB
LTVVQHEYEGARLNSDSEPTTTLSIRVPVQLKDALGTLARATGRNRNTLAIEALRRFIAVEQWQIAEIEAGLAEADAGDFATSDEIEAAFGEYGPDGDRGEQRRVS